MILDKEIKFIDFGLSFFSAKEEDKAVDLHLLRQALESKHHEKWEDCFKAALKGYKQNKRRQTMEEKYSRTGLEIAVIGAAGRFPGAKNIDEFWNNLKNGGCSQHRETHRTFQ